MTGRSALLGDKSEHQSGVEQRCIGRRQVARDQHIRLIAVRHTRHRHTEQPRDDPVAHIVEVRDPSRQILPGSGQQSPIRGKRVVHRTLGAAPDDDAPIHVGHELGVLGHHGLRLEHRLRLAAGQMASGTEVGRNSVHGLASTPLLALGLLRGIRLAGGSSTAVPMCRTSPIATPWLTPTPRSVVSISPVSDCAAIRATAVDVQSAATAPNVSLPVEQCVANLDIAVLADVGEGVGRGLQRDDRADR